MTARRVLLILVTGGALLAAVMVAGGYNVSAAAGHWRVVAAILHLTMHNSVTVRASGPVPDDLESDARALAGAGHYELVCRDCHGAPGVPLTAVARSLEPPPPHILEAVRRWPPEELFWIVKHGIKMTAMPAWPSPHRDDEVWSLVAFLLRLPAMAPNTYLEMVSGAQSTPREAPAASEFDAELARCARCHGYDGLGFNAAGLPRLDVHSPAYLENSLRAFAEGARASGIMQAHASVVPHRHFPALARHYGESGDSLLVERWPERSGEGDERARGERIAREGLPHRRVPACAACHGPAPFRRAEAYPVLAGQPQRYLETQLRLFRDGHRGGSAYAAIMSLAAKGLEDPDISAVADYYAGFDVRDQEIAPTDQEIAPTDQEIGPADQEIAPTDREVAPTDR